MKILVINKFFTAKGGSEKYMFGLRDLLRAHGHEVMDFSMSDIHNEPSKFAQYFMLPIDFETSKGFFDRIHKVAHLIYSRSAAQRLERLLQQEGIPEIAHLHNFNYQLTPSIIEVLKKYKVPIVWTIHDYKSVRPLHYKRKAGKCAEQSLIKRFIIWLEFFYNTRITKNYFKIDRYITPSQFLYDLTIDAGFPEERVRQLYNYIDLANIEPSYEASDYYVFVGRLIPEKGIWLLMDAFRKMPDKKLKIIGDGPLADEMKEYLSKYEMSNVEIFGAKYGEELNSIIKLSKALIFTSNCLENNPLVILEAMSLGKPVIASRIGGVPEMMQHGVTGYLFDPTHEDELIAAVDKMEQEDLAVMGRAARIKVERMADKEAHFNSLMKIYQEARIEAQD